MKPVKMVGNERRKKNPFSLPFVLDDHLLREFSMFFPSCHFYRLRFWSIRFCSSRILSRLRDFRNFDPRKLKCAINDKGHATGRKKRKIHVPMPVFPAENLELGFFSGFSWIFSRQWKILKTPFKKIRMC